MAGSAAVATAVRHPEDFVPGSGHRSERAVQHARRPSGVSMGAVAAGSMVQLRERMRPEQVARPVLTVVPRQVGPVDCPRVAASRGYRMGRWERLSMTVIVAAAVLVALVSSLGASGTETRDIVVQPGDTMLTIALQQLPDMDPARAAEIISAANGRGDLQLVPGMSLAIPVGASR